MYNPENVQNETYGIISLIESFGLNISLKFNITHEEIWHTDKNIYL